MDCFALAWAAAVGTGLKPELIQNRNNKRLKQYQEQEIRLEVKELPESKDAPEDPIVIPEEPTPEPIRQQPIAPPKQKISRVSRVSRGGSSWI